MKGAFMPQHCAVHADSMPRTVVGTMPAIPCESEEAVARGKAPLGGGAETGLGQGESFVLLLIFYQVLNERINGYNVMARLVSLYERCTGKIKHRHVGISLGVRKKDNQIAILPYDLSCWNSRLSGVCYLSDDDTPALRGGLQAAAAGSNSIAASDALYVDIHVTMVDEILQNFRLRSGAFVWNKLPRKGVRYPSLRTILTDHLRYTFSYGRPTVTLSRVDLELESINSESQCAQYVLPLVVSLLRNKQIPHATTTHMNSIFSLVFRKTSLHPHLLWQSLVDTGVFAQVGAHCKVRTLRQFTVSAPGPGGPGHASHQQTHKLTDIKLTNPYDTEIALNEILIWEFKNLHNFARPWGPLPPSS